MSLTDEVRAILNGWDPGRESIDRVADRIATLLAVHKEQSSPLRELLKAADDLCFECDGVLQTKAPSRETYNRAFLVIKAVKDMLSTAALTAQESTKPVSGKVCWFIERGTGEWWTGDARIDWTRDPRRAVRFCRREDADAVILGRDTNSSTWRDCNPFATEHIFMGEESARPEG